VPRLIGLVRGTRILQDEGLQNEDSQQNREVGAWAAASLRRTQESVFTEASFSGSRRLPAATSSSAHPPTNTGGPASTF